GFGAGREALLRKAGADGIFLTGELRVKTLAPKFREPALDCPRVSLERLPEVVPKEARLIGGDAGEVALSLLIGVKDGLLFRGKRRRCRPRGQFVTLPGVWVIERVSPRLVVAQGT